MKEIEEVELHKLNEVELSEKEIKERKKWIEDAQKSGRIFLRAFCLIILEGR